MGQTSPCECSGQDEEEITLQQIRNDQYKGRIDAPSRQDAYIASQLQNRQDGGGLECGDVWSAVCSNSVGGQESRDHHGVMLRDGPGFIDIYSSSPEGEVVPYAPPMPLAVPQEFKRVEYKWGQPSSAQSQPTPQQQERLRTCLKPFVRSMLTGVLVQLRLDAQELEGTSEAQNIDAVLSLTQDLHLLLISVGGVERSVPMRSVRCVRPPERSKQGRSWFQPKEQDHFVVLRLEGGRFVRLRFEEHDQAAYFGTCIRLLVKAAHTGSQDKAGGA